VGHNKWRPTLGLGSGGNNWQTSFEPGGDNATAVGAYPVTEVVVSSTTKNARRQQQSPRSSISIVPDSRGSPTFNLFNMSAQMPRGAPVAWGDADAQPHLQPTTPTGGAHRSRQRECHRAFHHHRSSTSRSSTLDVRHRHRIRPQQFHDAGSFESFWANFENCATYNKWTEADKPANLKALLMGNAAQVL